MPILFHSIDGYRVAQPILQLPMQPTMLYDTHCHLDAAEFGGTQADIVRNAAAVGVNRLVIPSVAMQQFQVSARTVQTISRLFPGLRHPSDVHRHRRAKASG